MLLCRRRKLALCWQVLVVSTLVAACAERPELLNSERIELRFGSYGVRVLQSDGQQRVSSLYSEEAEGEVCRTYARVEFLLPLDARLATEHRTILAGGSIGQEFSQAGWQTDKETVSIGETLAAEYTAEISDLMQVNPTVPLAIHRYRFEVKRGELQIPYAIITEIHHPDYLTVRQLHDIYD